MNPSIQLSPDRSADTKKSASTTRTMTTTCTLWTFLSHVIPNLPLCFSNYARSDTKYDETQVNLIVQA